MTHMMAYGWKRRMRRQATTHLLVLMELLCLHSWCCCLHSRKGVPVSSALYWGRKDIKQPLEKICLCFLSPREWEAGSLGIRQPFEDVKDMGSF